MRYGTLAGRRSEISKHQYISIVCALRGVAESVRSTRDCVDVNRRPTWLSTKLVPGMITRAISAMRSTGVAVDPAEAGVRSIKPLPGVEQNCVDVSRRTARQHLNLLHTSRSQANGKRTVTQRREDANNVLVTPVMYDVAKRVGPAAAICIASTGTGRQRTRSRGRSKARDRSL